MKQIVIFFLCFIWAIAANAQWERVYQGRTPVNAFVAGREADGTPLYLARARYRGGVHIGKVRKNALQAFIPYGGRELLIENYEVFVGTGEWAVATANNFPNNAIVGGYEANGARLYIAKAKLNGGIHPGKAHQSGYAYIAWGGAEKVLQQYYVLIPTSYRQESDYENSSCGN